MTGQKWVFLSFLLVIRLKNSAIVQYFDCMSVYDVIPCFRWQPPGICWIYVCCLSCNLFQWTSLDLRSVLTRSSLYYYTIWMAKICERFLASYDLSIQNLSCITNPSELNEATCHQIIKHLHVSCVISPKGLSAAILSRWTSSFMYFLPFTMVYQLSQRYR